MLNRYIHCLVLLRSSKYFVLVLLILLVFAEAFNHPNAALTEEHNAVKARKVHVLELFNLLLEKLACMTF